MRRYLSLLLLLFPWLLAACGVAEPEVLRLATTTSTENSGLLAEILPEFETAHEIRVDVIAVGTGQALALGEAGDVDVILVHARSQEEGFVAAGHGTVRYDVMYNDFILVGPAADPAGIAGLPLASEALAAIAASGATFASRGDDSGTHFKELALWAEAGLAATPAGEWYKSLGQGMSATLQFANETGAYTLTDRGTYLSLSGTLPNLVVLAGGAAITANQDASLFNPYSVIPINPDKGAINRDAAERFVAWLTSVETQARIAGFGRERYGQPLFYPNSEAWRTAP